MAKLFGSEDMAAGYALSRPPVHERVIERLYRKSARSERFRLALDVGCGAGVSTKALAGFAENCIGLEPMKAMLKWAARIAPFAVFVAGAAEAIPLRSHSVDLISAAGSLNYANLDLFFPEAARVLTQEGVLVIYDFSPGRSFRDATSLDEWFSSFYSRYPPPQDDAQHLDPAILAEYSNGLRVLSQEQFEIGIVLSPGFYLDYLMTETNVATAVRRGVPLSEVRSWCSETLAAFWSDSEREVLFRGYFVCMGLGFPGGREI
jgi:SAM-dependent methyltransferase